MHVSGNLSWGSGVDTLVPRAGIPIVVISWLLCAGSAGAEVLEVRLVSAVAGVDGPATEGPVYARADQEVTLYPVLVIREDGRTHYVSDAGDVVIDGRRHRARPRAEGPPALFRWYVVEPALENLSNTASGRFRFEPIEYAEVPAALFFPGRLRADVRPRLTPDRGDGVGTMRYKLLALTTSGVLTTPGAEARAGRGAGGLADSVHRVTIRRDDTYLGYLTEMYGQPYIWASAGTSDARHQSERLEGSDCADFVVYGRRRMGHAIPYTWTGGLPAHTRLLASGEVGPDGIYRDADGEPLPFTEVGDLLLFPRHVGVLTEDRGHLGVLDTADLMMHTLFESPGEEPIARSGYADRPVEVRRWR
jgi:hypothetical protein